MDPYGELVRTGTNLILVVQDVQITEERSAISCYQYLHPRKIMWHRLTAKKEVLSDADVCIEYLHNILRWSTSV